MFLQGYQVQYRRSWQNIQEEDLASVGLRETAIRMVVYDWISAEVGPYFGVLIIVILLPTI